MDRAWRLIIDGPSEAAWNMAVDETLFRTFRAGANPALRFYSWDRPSITLGRFQKVEGAIDISFCESHYIPIVRRPTGGRAVLHGTDLTFSLVKGNDGDSVRESYTDLSLALSLALRSLGVPVETISRTSNRREMRSISDCFQLKAEFELSLDGRKVLGSAQMRTSEGILQQNSLVLWASPADNHNAFVGGCPNEGVPRSVGDYANCNEVIQAICQAIEKQFGVRFEPSLLSEEEHRMSEQLTLHKYRAEAWNALGERGFVDTTLAAVVY
jgi:lipoyl(octanoyl) transferase